MVYIDPFAVRESLASERPVRIKFSVEAHAPAGALIKAAAMMGSAPIVVQACQSPSAITIAITTAVVAVATSIKSVATSIKSVTTSIKSVATSIKAAVPITVAIASVVAVAIVVILSRAGTIMRAQGIGWLRCYTRMGAMNTVEICILRKCANAK